jgi:hypothetical protein
MGCLLVLLLLFGGGFLTARQSSTISAPATPQTSILRGDFGRSFSPVYVDDTGVAITRFTSAIATEADGCPADETSTFRRSDDISVFAIGAFPRGTTVFARMSYDGVPVEDTDTLTADQNYDDVCVYFTFEPTIGAEVFDRGPYVIEFFINGASAGSLDLVIE